MPVLANEEWKAQLRRKLLDGGYVKQPEFAGFLSEFLGYLRLIQLIYRDKVTLDDVRADVVRMAIGLSGAAYEIPFFVQIAGRAMPMFQLAIVGYMDAAKYAQKLEDGKTTLTPDEKLKLMENISATNKLHREFAMLVVGAESGLAKQTTQAMGLRTMLDEMFEE